MTEIHAIEMGAVTRMTLKDGVIDTLRSAILDQSLNPVSGFPKRR